MRTWQVQDVRSKFSQILEDAVEEGPQVITKRGVETAVLISYSDYRQLTAGRKNLFQFFAESPLAGVDIDLTRGTRPPREGPDL